MNEKNQHRLNAIPLTEVMQGWGYVPKRNGDASASFLCPWHDDHRPSLIVDKVIRDGADDLGFKCFACGQTGFGAVQLAARLMGYHAGQLSKTELQNVTKELLSRCNVELEDEGEEKKHIDALRTSLIGWDDFRVAELQYAEWTGESPIFEQGEWTEEGLKSLGLKLELASRKMKESECSEYPVYSEVKVGDMLTQFDPDTGDALYRCSLGRDFYRGPQKAETRTIKEWGEEVRRIFGVEPVGRFIQRIEPKQGGAVARIVRATRNYPIFMFSYPWGIKKYEPKDSYGNKWTWWSKSEDADLYHRWYADAALADMLEGVLPEPDTQHPYVERRDNDGKSTGKYCFERVVLCSGPRDAMAVYSHCNAHVCWLHSEQAGFDKKGRPNRWLRGLLKKLLSVTAEGGLYVCYDEDSTGLAASRAIALNSPQVRWLRLPKELTEVENANYSSPTRKCKDVTDFVTRFQEVESLMPAEVQHDDPVEWFDNALFDTPTCQFWQWESERKDADGKGRARYKFDLRNTPVFLRARGMVRTVMQQGKVSFSRYFLFAGDNTFTECFPGEKGANKLVALARDLMAEWLRAHKDCNDDKGALSRAIYSAKLEQSTLESIEQINFDVKSFGEDFDYFFFHNTAVKVTKDEVKKVQYGQMKWMTNAEAIMDGDFSVLPKYWHVVENPLYATELLKHRDVLSSVKTADEVAQENMRWDAWENLWHYLLKLDKPLDEMPLHFRFLYNTCRIFWEKESAGAELTATEKQVQDMYMIAMLHALGSALVRHRSANRQQYIHITDNGTRREDLASGGTGKTVLLELLGLVRRVLKVDGKALEDGNVKLSQELDKVIPGLHSIIAIDELPQGFSPKMLYNYTLSITSRGLYRSSVVLEGDDLPKFVVASNEQLDLSSDSTSRRTYQVLVSDWYHPRSMDGSRPARTPADDFYGRYGIKEVARNLPPALLNEARNLLLGCTQLFFQLPDETMRPPRDSRAMLRQALAASKDEKFTRWMTEYLADKRHIGTPIAQRELAISLLDYCGITIGEKTLKAAYKRIRDNLDDYLRTSIYVVDPHVVLLTATDREKGFRRTPAWQHPMNPDGTIKTDRDGNRLPRELDKLKPPRTYYFYPKSRIPRHFYSPGHEGDKDYVQAAPEVDHEADMTVNSKQQNTTKQ